MFAMRSLGWAFLVFYFAISPAVPINIVPAVRVRNGISVDLRLRSRMEEHLHTKQWKRDMRFSIELRSGPRSFSRLCRTFWCDRRNQLLCKFVPCWLHRFSEELLVESSEKRGCHQQVGCEFCIYLRVDPCQSLFGEYVFLEHSHRKAWSLAFARERFR